MDQVLDELAKAKKDELVAKFDSETQQVNEGVSLTQQLEDRFKEAMEEYNRCIREFNHNFAQKNELEKNLEVTLKNKVKAIKDRQSMLLVGDCEDRSRRIIMENVSEQVSGLSDKFWEDNTKLIAEIRNKAVQHYIDKFQWIFDKPAPAKDVEEMKVKFYNSYKEEVRRALENTLVEKVLKIFTKMFVQDKSGVVRNWLVMTDEQISDYFDTARDYALSIIDTVCYVPGLETSSFIDEREGEELFDSAKIARMKDDAEQKMSGEYERIVRNKVHSD